MLGVNPKATYKRSHVKWGDHVSFRGAYAGIVVDISDDGTDMRVEPIPGTIPARRNSDGKLRDTSAVFDFRMLEVTKPPSGPEYA